MAKRKRQSRKPTSVDKLRGREFNPDYSYVLQDLKRIVTLASFFIVSLIVLSFILN
ncbi:MAG: hypothetical protein JXB38_04490 [Anaerolineales bacterium]|nr:hypothetical protein [Anaerolineales bacterium]